jgi:hypothetical protein
VGSIPTVSIAFMTDRYVAEDGGVAADVTDMLHDRAVVWLRTHLRAQRYHAARRHVTADDPVAHAGHEGRLLAMERVGAITAVEAAAWRQRLSEAMAWREPPYEPLPDEVGRRAAAHLEDLLKTISPSTREAAPACSSAIAAYEETGVVKADEALAWRERLRSQLGLEPERGPRCSRRELVRVVPGPAKRVHGLRITSVELYGDGVILRWHHARRWPERSTRPRIWNDIDIETAGAHDLDPRGLADDVGTRYAGGGGPDFGINGGGWVVRLGTSSFAPAAPRRARRLHVPLRDGGIDVDL